MSRRLAAVLAAHCIRADWVRNVVYSDAQCLGQVMATESVSVGLNGCVREGSGSYRLTCTNASFGVTSFYSSVIDCVGIASGRAPLPLSIGCSPRSSSSGETQQCVFDGSVPPVVAPAGSALLIDYNVDSCSTVSQAVMRDSAQLVTGLCTTVDAQSSSRTECNATHVFTNAYAAGCTGTPTLLWADTIGCSSTPFGTGAVSCTAATSGGASGESAAVIGGAIGGAIAGLAVLALAAAWYRGVLNRGGEAKPLLGVEKPRAPLAVAAGVEKPRAPLAVAAGAAE